MKAFFFTGLTAAWSTSLSDRPWCLAPMGGKPLIECWFEWAASLGVRDIRLVLGDGADQIEGHCGDGSRWGLVITYGFLRDLSDPAAFLRRAPRQWEDGLLYIACPVFPRRLKGPDIRESCRSDTTPEPPLADSRAAGAPPSLALENDARSCAECPSDSRSAAIRRLAEGTETRPTWLLRDSRGAVACFLSRDKAAIQALTNGRPPAAEGDWSALELEPVLLDGIEAYYQLNMRLVGGEIARYVQPGFGGEDGARIGSNVIIPPSAELRPPLIIGNNCRIHPMAVIGPDVVIGNGVIIDRQTELTQSVVVDDTYLGRHLEIRNRVVSGSRLVDPSDGTVLDVADPWLIAPLDAPVRVSDVLCAFGGWVIAVMLTLLHVLPFCLFLLLLRALGQGVFRFSPRLVLGSRVRRLPHWHATAESSRLNRAFTGLSLDLFPLIALAALGRLWLCGHQPLHPGRDAGLRGRLRHYYPAALGYHTARSAPAEARTATMAEALYYERYRGPIEDLQILCRTLFTRLLSCMTSPTGDAS